MAGLLDSIWPYIPPGFREAIFGGNDYTQRQPSPGLAPAQAAPTQRPGLLSPLMEMSPGADIRDAVGYSDSSFNNLAAGNIGQGLLDMAYIPASLAGIMLPGSSSQYRKAGGAVTDAIDAARRIEDPINAYHSSPHDFKQFDISKVGTGEGAQAYGHGLYAAENRNVAHEYRDMFIAENGFEGKNFVLEIDGTRVSPNDLDQVTREAALILRDAGGDVNKALQEIRSSYYPEAQDRMAQAINSLASGGAVFKPAAHTYEVAIHARPEEFLDWDAPLRDQPTHIRDFFTNKPEVAPERLDVPIDPNAGTYTDFDIPGQLAYYRLGNRTLNSPDASAALREAGIPGIKYLDQGSRGSIMNPDWKRGTTSNYVVFDDKLIEILRKYGLLGPMLGGAAATGLLGGGDDRQY